MKNKRTSKKSIGLGLLNAISMRFNFNAIFVVLAALVTGNVGQNTAIGAVGLMLVSIVGKSLHNTTLNYSVFMQVTLWLPESVFRLAIS